MADPEREIRRVGRFVGLTEIVGVLGVIGAVLLLVEQEHVAAGLFLVAAAVAFGLGANALLRR